MIRSQGQDSRNCFAFSLSKTSKYLCSSRSTILERVWVSSFFAFSFWASLVEKFIAQAIHVSVKGVRSLWVLSSSCVNSHISGSGIFSSFLIGHWVQFRGSLGLGSSYIMVCCICLSSNHLFCISTILLVAAVNFWFIVCLGMKILPVFQLIVGLCSFNHGSPSKTSLFPVFMMRNLVRSYWFGFKKGIVRIQFFSTKVQFMKSPLAPLSRRV